MQQFLAHNGYLVLGAFAGLLVVALAAIVIEVVRRRRSAKANVATKAAQHVQTEVVRMRFPQGSIAPPLTPRFPLPLAQGSKPSKRKTGLRPTHARRPGQS